MSTFYEAQHHLRWEFVGHFCAIFVVWWKAIGGKVENTQKKTRKTESFVITPVCVNKTGPLD